MGRFFQRPACWYGDEAGNGKPKDEGLGTRD
jgi:hypothetical protein